MRRRRFLKNFVLSAGGIFVPRIVRRQFTHTDIPWLAGKAGGANCSDSTGIVSNWVTRVGNNGGAAPSQNTQNALCTFVNSMVSAGLITNISTSVFFTLNFFVPDNTVATLTPLIVGTGIDPYTTGIAIQNSFLSTAGLLTTNSHGVGSVNTGVQHNTNFTSSSMGIHVYGQTPSALPNYDIGGGDSSLCAEIFCNGSSIPFFGASYSAWNVQPGSGIISNGEYGFVSLNRTALSGANAVVEYIANANHAWQVLGTSTASGASEPTGTNKCGIDMAGVCAGVTLQMTCSFLAFSSGLTMAQGQNLFNAVQACRQILGGGFT